MFAQAPDPVQPALYWAISLSWVAAIELIMHPIQAHTRHARRCGDLAMSIKTSARGHSEAPSARMRAAHLMVRAGSGTEAVARLARIPHALADLIVADVRGGVNVHEHRR